MTKNFAHRGFSGKYPENTMLAFEKAIAEGVDGIELDVQLTKDGEVVIIHDETIDRTTNGKGYVVEYTYEELSKFDASYIYTGKMGFNKIPTLREYFELVKDLDIVTNIELKTGINEYLGIEEKVWDMIKEFGLQDRIIISSFNHFSVMRMKKLAPEMKYGFLSEDWIIDAGKYTHSHGVQCYHPRFNNLIPEVIDELKSYGLEINTWTVNKEEDMRYLISHGIDAIIGNYPDLAKKIIMEK
ncbi:Glycerophosphodiester phosphodiesterase [Fusobacterium sp. DD29]|uniref:glycerophosphodiester phosphodiesterase n=1 Tax=unclassified Fusobacterium TaxID=2648384 RepID=UPI001B8D2976|nr:MULTISPECIES: glycerophosphodiester phosphodiesterase [unclassified Fusobacterium]MBR8700544.1 Glycerophosphodiester phosphodiesterase [Fusobacterium sp. DD45]MBR8710293.1 Glycerophosphodiester phosphodiesterase [Fusobacterium sp. DD28]MBR8749563.1 Glycerophosphodiester phosphodiesterase [Fusobacterium sp. DD29]MBR8750821.1 Glycerophosphodiester phosphodiesterase [Fusobacterium sp. DD26]MBR8761849.1 Glycerophosphodiester phosphodiesterase [Fusobacterium sp. DD25]